MSEHEVEYDAAAVRAGFSALQHGVAHFDSPGGTQTPDVVADAMAAVLKAPLSNRGTLTRAARNADEVVVACRAALGDLLAVDPATVLFGRSMTALTFDLSRVLGASWRPGDEVVVSGLDHDANVRPWVVAAERAGAVVRVADPDPTTAELSVEAVASQLSERTVLVAVTAASNLVGTQPDVAGIAAEVHRGRGLLFVDGVHHTAHASVDVPAIGADLYACSPYKLLGPHCGVVTGRAEVLEALHPDKLLPSPDRVPERFELGTLPYELMAGTTAAVDVLAGLVPGGGSRRERLERSYAALHAHDERLRTRIEAGLADLPGVTQHARAERRTPTLLVTFADHDAADVATHLAALGVNAPAGTFYAHEPARALGLPGGGLRVGLAPYSDDDDVDRLLDGLAAAVG
ncbi:cysteine desulfurase-like protein [Nocardioides marmoraquaticus]